MIVGFLLGAVVGFIGGVIAVFAVHSWYVSSSWDDDDG